MFSFFNKILFVETIQKIKNDKNADITKKLGNWGNKIARKYLQQSGFILKDRHFLTRNRIKDAQNVVKFEDKFEISLFWKIFLMRWKKTIKYREKRKAICWRVELPGVYHEKWPKSIRKRSHTETNVLPKFTKLYRIWQ